MFDPEFKYVEGVFYIYCITYPNGKKYVGQAARDPRSRYSSHIREANSDEPDLTCEKAMKKYGVENCNCEVIACSKIYECLDDLETELIKQHESHVSTGKGYNVSQGGQFTRPWSDYEKQKASERMKARMAEGGKVLNDWLAAIEKSRIANKGKKLTDEQKETLRIANTGSKRSEETCKKISDLKNEFWSNEENREYMSKIMKEKFLNPEFKNIYDNNCRKQADAQRGTKLTEEHKKKCSDSLRTVSEEQVDLFLKSFKDGNTLMAIYRLTKKIVGPGSIKNWLVKRIGEDEYKIQSKKNFAAMREIQKIEKGY